MNKREFIRRHRDEIDATINAVIYQYDGSGGYGTVPTPAPRYNDAERAQWLLNDESLYFWARSEGVNL